MTHEAAWHTREAERLSHFLDPNNLPTYPTPPRARPCGACGPRGKCVLLTGHRGKHEAIKGFKW